MRNFKKLLSLVLCMAVMLSVMVVGAGAAFSDQSKIKNTEAVDMCVALNIINGYEDGSFKPDGNVTRAEMCKMICIALNGGKEPATATKVTPTYTDIKGHWAEGYIEYCSTKGIVAGVGDGKFNPNGNVTGSQAAKMLLVALGYNADVEKFVGASWELYVNVKANQDGLYTDLESMDPSAALSRDNAAQMIYNTLNADTIKVTSSIDRTDGSVVDTYEKSGVDMLAKAYQAKSWIGDFTGNYKTGDASKEGYIEISGAIDGNLKNNPDNAAIPAEFKNDLDIQYIGEEVKVIFKDGVGGIKDQPDDKDTIYGVYVTGATTVYNIVKGDLQDADSGKIKFGGKNYKAAAEIAVYTNLSSDTATLAAVSAFDKNGTYYGDCADTIKFIVEDGKITTAYITNYTLAKVTGVSSEKISLSGIGSKKFADHEIADGLKKDDVVVVSHLFAGDNETYFVEKADSISGKLTAYNVGQNSVSIDGTKYAADADFTTLSDSDFTTIGNLDSSDLNEDYEAYVVNGFVMALKKTSDSVVNYALVDSVGGSGTKVDPYKVYMVLADGTKGTYTVASDSSYDPYTFSPDTEVLVKYTTNKDGEVKLTDVGTAMIKANYDKNTKQLKDNTTNVGVVATDCVMFVKTAADKYSVYTDVRGLGNINSDKDSMPGLYKTNTDGKVVAAYIELMAKPAGSTSDTMYGIVTSEGSVTKDDDTSYVSFSVYANGQDMTIKFEGDQDSNISIDKGDLVYFDKTSDNVYSVSDVKVATNNALATGLNVQIKEYDESGKILTYTTAAINNDGVVTWGDSQTLALDDDVVIVYVNTDGDKGGEDIGVVQADTTKVDDDGVIVPNARIITKDGKVIAIYVDDEYDITK
ncbi:MAG: S-layer homology domain-containing protein [Bacillota bacterium]|nr:S-layer homology domain-containing protein [Bacillota bacterium]